MKVRLEYGPYFTFLLVADNGASRLVQHDTDFPGVARSFGWCGNGHETGEAIWDAYEYLERQAGTTIDDPGYF